MRNHFLFTFLFLAFSASLFGQDCPVFPKPKTYVVSGGNLILEDVIAVSTVALTSQVKDDLKWSITHELGLNVAFVADGGDLLFKRLVNVPMDHYTLKIDKQIVISYSSDASLFYAIQTLKQLFQKENESYVLPQVFISDEPSFQWRGMHLDVSRHFFTVEEVKRYLDWMARYKFNKFHWHLTDDQGWRIQIKKYPKLTEIGSVREQTLIGHASSEPNRYDGKKHSGFYTQDEIKEIVAYAAKLYIEVIPEIEMPGHARAALAAYPEYSCDGEKLPVAQTWGVFEKVFCSKDETLVFLKDILSEVVELFPGKYVHIGGDEAPKTSWKACDKCQLQMKAHLLKSEEELQSFFIQQMDDYLQTKGKTLIGWDEILEGGLSKNAVVMSWRGMKGGIEAAEQNHYVIMTPGSHCYFDHYQSDRSSEPLAIGGYTTLEKVYSFQPIPKELSADKKGLILGAQANVWSEYLENFQQVEYMILPRMIALSEVLWGTNTDYAAFLNRLETYEFPYLDRKKANYSRAAWYMSSNIDAVDAGVEIRFQSFDKSNKIQIEWSDNAAIEAKNEQTILLKQVDQPTPIRVQARSEKDTLQLNLWQHSTLGEQWQITPAPSTSYPGKGATTLTDGVLGARPWNGKEWLGFNEGDVTLKLDCGTTKKQNALTVSLLKAPTSWIYLPETIVLRYSKNGKKWKTITYKVTEEKSRIALAKKFRYLELTIQNMSQIPTGQNGAGHAPWLFLDEIWME